MEGTMSDLNLWLSGIYQHLLTGDMNTLAEKLSDNPAIVTPFSPQLSSGREAFDQSVQQIAERLGPYKLNAVCREIRYSNGIYVGYFVLMGNVNGDHILLPVALVAQMKKDKIHQLRIYHSTWPMGDLTQPSTFLSPLSLDLPGPLANLIRGMQIQNPKMCLHSFSESAFIQESLSETYRHQGSKSILEYLDILLSRGGLMIQPCGLMQDKHFIALEYNCGYGISGKANYPGLALMRLDQHNQAIEELMFFDSLGLNE